MTVIPESNLVAHARRELALAGLFDKESAYDGMIASSVMELVRVLSEQRHSGGSAALTLQIFNVVANYDILTPIRYEPDQWNDVSEITGQPMWQHKRKSSVMSFDQGETWFDIEEDTGVDIPNEDVVD
jgi:hypothetical protein